MPQLPSDPLAPASTRQLLSAGVIFAVAGAAFLAFTAWLLFVAHTLGRLGQMPVILLTAFLIIVSVGCFDAAFAVFWKREQRRKHLLSTPALYVIGGLLVVFPLMFLIFAAIVRPEAGLLPALKSTPLSAFGLWAISLAHLRRKKESP